MEKELEKVIRKLNRQFYWVMGIAVLGFSTGISSIVMLVKVWKRLCVLGVLAIFWSCEDTATSIPKDVLPEVYEFQQEARVYGLNPNLSGLKIKFGTIDGLTAGMAYPRTRTIIFDSLSFSYRHNKRCLIFHEMAHIFVPGRQKHDDTLMGTTQVEKSIMNGNGLPICTGDWAYRWAYYVEELFNPNTPTPEWADHY